MAALISQTSVSRVSCRAALARSGRRGAAGRQEGCTAIRAAKAEESGLEGVVKDPVEEAFIALSKAWARAPMAAKRKFVADRCDDLEGLLNDHFGVGSTGTGGDK